MTDLEAQQERARLNGVSLEFQQLWEAFGDALEAHYDVQPRVLGEQLDEANRRARAYIEACKGVVEYVSRIERSSFTAREVLAVHNTACWDGGSVNRVTPDVERLAAKTVRRAMDALQAEAKEA